MEEKLCSHPIDRGIYKLFNRRYLERFQSLVGLTWMASLPLIIGGVLLCTDYKVEEKIEQESPYIMQIQRLEDRDGKKGYDTMILEDGRELQIENKKGLLYVIEKK